MRNVITAIVVLAVLVAGPALADLSIYGPSGLLRVPTIDTVGAGGMQFGANWVADDVFTVGMTTGVVDRLELSATYVRPDGGDNNLVASGKWRLFREGEREFGLAAGVFDITDELNRTFFGVAQKYFLVGNTWVRAVGGWGEANSMVDGLFAGAEVFLGNDWSALVEYDGEDVNAGVRWPINDRIKLSAGSVSDDLFIGAQYVLR